MLFAGTLTFARCYKDKGRQFSFYFFFTADITRVINAAVKGTYLYVKSRQFKKSLKQQYRRFRVSFKSQKFWLPGLIVLFYLVFQTTGSFLFALLFLKKPSFIYRKIALILFAMGFLSDCLIYIFINPNARKILARKLALRKRNFQRDWISFYSEQRTNMKHILDYFKEIRKGKQYFLPIWPSGYFQRTVL